MQKERRRAEARATRQPAKILEKETRSNTATLEKADANSKVIPAAQTGNTESASSDSFFKDESSKTIFYLLHMSGEERTNVLGISAELYDNAQKARSWYVRMSKLVHPDNTDNPEAANAFREIQRIYKRMKQLGTDQRQTEATTSSRTAEKTTKTATAAKTESSYQDAFFKDESSKTIFYLLHMSGKERTDFLGIKEKLYGNQAEARKWYTRMSKLVHPDNTDNPEAALAFKEIQRIYGRMKR